jgi:hypothetical protein
VIAPIFLNCFSRGGSNILWNIFLSHPRVCSPIHETLAIFRADWRRPTRAGLWFALLSGQPHFFDQWYLHRRRSLSRPATRFMEATLQHWKMKTLADSEMRFKSEGEVYSKEDVEGCRLALKHNNGLAFLTDQLAALYPDAVFIALVREPVALYESHRRRRIAKTAEHFAPFFNSIARTMIEDSERLQNYHLVRFEDVLDDPIATAVRVHRLAGLDPSLCPRFRFKAKKHFRADGSYGSERVEGSHHWMTPEEVRAFLEPSVNRVQAQQLDPGEVGVVLDRTREVRDQLGYA